MIERLLIPMPCGHLMEYTDDPVFNAVCVDCDRRWSAVRKKGAIEVREV